MVIVRTKGFTIATENYMDKSKAGQTIDTKAWQALACSLSELELYKEIEYYKRACSSYPTDENYAIYELMEDTFSRKFGTV